MTSGSPNGRPRARFGYVPGYHHGTYHVLQRKLFGTRRFSREMEYRILCDWVRRADYRALDLACGYGDFSWPLALEGHQVFAIDLNGEALREARRVALHVGGVHVLAGDALRLPFASHCFDMCLCNSSLEHFPDEDAAFREVARVLKPEGRLLITTDSFPPASTWPTRSVPRAFLKNEIGGGDRHEAIRRYHQQKHHVVRYYTQDRLTQKLREHGFAVLETRSYLAGFWPRLLFELHILLKALDFYNTMSQRLYPLFYPLTLLDSARRPGYGVAALAVKSSGPAAP